eukprot:TRINITY_DN9079_c0_g1_i14.p1 TRINITY_DN9079_c0_g1~~TRINITY_DN9079_c0_g1_i14.p1  ORF type:complete len:220 (+),score=13.78 TRINITY_DN9079_c0_g1_i14:494-1153(+)
MEGVEKIRNSWNRLSTIDQLTRAYDGNQEQCNQLLGDISTENHKLENFSYGIFSFEHITRAIRARYTTQEKIKRLHQILKREMPSEEKWRVMKFVVEQALNQIQMNLEKIRNKGGSLQSLSVVGDCSVMLTIREGVRRICDDLGVNNVYVQAETRGLNPLAYPIMLTELYAERRNLNPVVNQIHLFNIQEVKSKAVQLPLFSKGSLGFNHSVIEAIPLA